MKDTILLILGAAIGVLFSECWKLLGLDQKFLKWMRRMSARPISTKLTDSDFTLGDRNTYTCMIDGNGDMTFDSRNIIIQQSCNEIAIPENLVGSIKSIENQEAEKKKNHKPYAWNGRVSHLSKFSTSRRENIEDGQLHLEFQIASYYHFIATTVKIYDEFIKQGLSSETRKELVAEFSEWRKKPVPNIVNGVALNLFVITDDNMLVFSKRSDSVAIAPGEITYAVNENLHPDQDRGGQSERLDIDILIRRALKEELGWDDPESSTGRADTKILGFAVHRGTCTYGIIGYTILPISFCNLQILFSKRAKDRHETSYLIPVLLNDINRLAHFIHVESLYNFVGVGAALTVHHGGLFRIEVLDRKLKEVQSQSDTYSQVIG